VNLKTEINPLISIIILNYNSGNLVKDCVASILASNYKNYEIIVVDNKSRDDSQNICKKQFPQIKLIQNNENMGFCEGNNVGIRLTKGKFVVLLNPDTKVDKKLFEEFLLEYNKKGEGLFQPKLLSMDEPTKINSAGNMIHIFGFGFSRGKGIVDTNQYDKYREINYPSGACLFTSKKIFEDIGIMDSFLWAYHDDLELGWRAAKFGFNSFFVPNAIVYHKESSNFKWSKKKFFLLERNRLYCLLTQYSKKTFRRLLPYLILVEIIVFFYYIKKGLFFEKIQGYKEIIKNLKKISEKQKELECLRKIEDGQIVPNFQTEIFVPQEVGSSRENSLFNKIIGGLARRAKNSIIK
jgi:GT2 family glycosyltransferase